MGRMRLFRGEMDGEPDITFRAYPENAMGVAKRKFGYKANEEDLPGLDVIDIAEARWGYD